MDDDDDGRRVCCLSLTAKNRSLIVPSFFWRAKFDTALFRERDCRYYFLIFGLFERKIVALQIVRASGINLNPNDPSYMDLAPRVTVL
jgi:hypothetical protein